MNKVFPIKTDTACLLKWSWSTVFLKEGVTSSCHRCDQLPIDPDNFAGFHNLPRKLEARRTMLRGQWPQGGCQYCQRIESAGGTSDRMYQFNSGREGELPPPELSTDPVAIEVTPTILEVYFNNTCNMSCVYCNSWLSTKWEEENKRFGAFHQGDVKFGYPVKNNPNYERMLADFWKYLEDRGRHIRYFQVLGGEPFFQPELDTCIEFWDTHPNPDLTFNIVTNLKVNPKKFRKYIDRFERMVADQHIRKLQMSCSLDCWGKEQEYVRQGLDLAEWQENFEYMLTKDWIQLSINSTITGLTIKTMPEFIENLVRWNQVRPKDKTIQYSFMSAVQPVQMMPDIFGPGAFDQEFEQVLELMPRDSSREHLAGVFKQINSKTRDVKRINDLKVYLTELDRRRNTNWKETFPWLDQEWT